MTKAAIAQPFVAGFSTEQEGGCPAAACGPDADCRVHGDGTGYCKANGWCRCEKGFGGQFCKRDLGLHKDMGAFSASGYTATVGRHDV
jgi:hypothetical protein